MFSIIIPLYNKFQTIKKTINSVLTQIEVKDFEIVVVNDGSTDGCDEIVKSIADNRIYMYDIENSGPSAARNYGVSKSTKEWVVFLDADDELLPNALSIMKTYIDKNRKIKVFSGNFWINDGNEVQLFSKDYSCGVLHSPFFSWFYDNYMPRAGSTAFKRELIEKYPYKEYLWRYEDAEVLFDIMRNEKIFRFTEPVMTYKTEFAEASKPRKNINEDFLGHLSLTGRSIGEILNIYELYLQALSRYPNEANIIYKKWGNYRFLKLCYKVANRIRVESKVHGNFMKRIF